MDPYSIDESPTLLPIPESRNDAINQYTSLFEQARQQRSDAINSLYDDSDMKMSGGQVAASALTGILPIIIGAAMHGLSGAAGGAQAGLLGATPLLDKAQKDQEEQKNKYKLLADIANKDAATYQSERQGLLKSQFDAEDADRRQAASDSRAYGLEGLRFQHEKELQGMKLAALGNKGDQTSDPDFIDMRDSAVAAARADKQIDPQYADALSRARNFNELDKITARAQSAARINQNQQKLEGGGIRLPSSSELQTYSQATAGLDTIKQLKEYAAQMSDVDSVTRSLRAGELIGKAADTNSPEYKFYALLPVAEKQYASLMESGKLTDKDVEMFDPLFRGDPIIDSAAAITNRLGFLSDKLTSQRQTFVDTLEKGRVNVSGFKEASSGNANVPASIASQLPQGVKVRSIKRID